MKRINCIILSFVCCVLSLSADAQSANKIGKGRFGLQAGVNFQSINGRDVNDNKLNSDPLTGYHLGLITDLKIAPGFYFQTGLLYTTKGGKNYLMQSYPSTVSTVRMSYLELPLGFVVKPMLGDGHILLGLGSYVSYGLAGKVKYTAEGIQLNKVVQFQNKVNPGDAQDVPYFRRMDAGLNMLAGYEFPGGFSFQLNTQLGLAKINPVFTARTNDNTLAQHTGFGLSLGYRW